MEITPPPPSLPQFVYTEGGLVSAEFIYFLQWAICKYMYMFVSMPTVHVSVGDGEGGTYGDRDMQK